MAGKVKTNEVVLQSPNGLQEATLSLSDSGVVSSNKYLTQQVVAFDVACTTTVSSGNFIIYNQVNTNSGNCYSTTNGRFTAPIAGYYLFSASTIKTTDASSVTALTFFINGQYFERQLRIAELGGYGENGAVTLIKYLNAGDYVNVHVSNGQSFASSQWTYFNGYRIG